MGSCAAPSAKGDDKFITTDYLQQCLKKWVGANEFINSVERWFLWLGECPPSDLRKMPECIKRVEAVRKVRLDSKSAPTRKIAETPTRFHVENIPDNSYLVIPEVTSERRTYIPIGFLGKDVLASNKLRILPNANLFHFGVIQSGMHMAWTRAVCGRLESRYQYSVTIVYNNFPWPIDATDKQKEAIEKAAKAILDARSNHSSSTLADLYDPLTMPPDLVKAHQALDRAVDAAYVPSGGKKNWATEAERVAFLFELYQKITSLLPAEKPKAKRKKSA